MSSERLTLVVDSNPETRKQVVQALEDASVPVDEADAAHAALEAVRVRHPALVVVEMFLADMTGLAFCRVLREDELLRHIPVLMVTSYTSEMDRVLAFEVGVDDFLARPFFARELAARARAVLRRSLHRLNPEGEEPLPASHALAVDPARGRVEVQGSGRVELTPKEFELLATLMRQSGRVMSRRELIVHVWGGGGPHTERAVDAHIKAIRRKLGPAKRCIETVRGVGYRFSDLTAR